LECYNQLNDFQEVHYRPGMNI